MYGQPTVAGGRVYAGPTAGFVYALNAATGCVYWSFQAQAGVRTAISIGPVKGGRYAAYFGDVKANVYAVDARAGSLIWTKRADTHPLARITGAPALHDGRLYVPVASLEELAGGNPVYECCTFRGSLVVYDASTGEQIWKTYTIARGAEADSKNVAGHAALGAGGSGDLVDARHRFEARAAVHRDRRRLHFACGGNIRRCHGVRNEDRQGGVVEAGHFRTMRLSWAPARKTRRIGRRRVRRSRGRISTSATRRFCGRSPTGATSS